MSFKFEKGILLSFFSISILAFIYGCLIAFGNSSYLFISLEEYYTVAYIFGFIMCTIGFISINMVSRRLHYKHDFFMGKYKLFRIICLSIFILSILSPFYSLHLLKYESVLERADYRYECGRWDEAISIYRLLSFRLKTPHQPIEEMQTILKSINYYDDKIDGVPHTKIIDQLKKFQQDNMLTPDGFCGGNTRNLIFGNIYKHQLYITSEKPNLDEVQEAVKYFQRRNGLSSDGIIGEKTLKKLELIKKY